MNKTRDFDTIIVGAGFAGMYLLHRLRTLGHRVLVLETGDGVGGTWYWNRYPGARCDIASMEYSYQFDEELQQEWNWPERYSSQPEILRYANHVADRFDLRPDIQFQTTVIGAQYDSNTNFWTVRTDDQAERTSTYLVAATGCLSIPSNPDITGIDQFTGDVYHTGRWPATPVDFSGKNVAVIGTGSSGIQAIPVIAEQAQHLTVFQRTANYAIPARNAPTDAEERDQIRANYKEFRRIAATTRNGHATLPNQQSALAATAEERERQYEARWQKGGLAFIGSFNDLILNEESNKTAADFVKRKIFDIVNDVETARLLSPKTKIGCKRLCVDSGYYDTFNRNNVSIVDISEKPVESLTAESIVVNGSHIPVDAIVFATGYDAMTGPVLRMNICGRSGIELKDSWYEGPKTYLGLACHGFPNFFTVTGPGSPSVLTNMLPTIEQHVNLITDILFHAQANGKNCIEANRDAQESWAIHVNSIASATIYPGCNSWYLGANIPGKPRVFMPYIGFSDYVERCRKIAEDGFKGFSFTAV